MHHVACRQVPFHGIGRQVIKDYAKIITSNHVSLVAMKTCKLVGLWRVMRGILNASYLQESISPQTRILELCMYTNYISSVIA